MTPNRSAALAWEAKWAKPVAAVAILAAVLVVGSFGLLQSIDFGEGISEQLRAIDENSGLVTVSKVLEAVGLALLVAPLVYLFRAAVARSQTMRGQLIGVAIAGPLFLAFGAILFIFTSLDAASEFVNDKLPQLAAEGVAIGSEEADDAASDLRTDSTLFQIANGLQLAGMIGFVVAMFYSALHAMRTGLLTRFWGSLGMALAVVSIFPLFRPFTVLWFLYFGLLIASFLPGGRPPAWSTGEAIPWPTPGERAAGELEGSPDEEDGEEGEPEAGADEGSAASGGERRKRKRRG